MQLFIGIAIATSWLFLGIVLGSLLTRWSRRQAGLNKVKEEDRWRVLREKVPVYYAMALAYNFAIETETPEEMDARHIGRYCSFNEDNGPRINLRPGEGQSKRVLLHEFGHFVWDITIGDIDFGGPLQDLWLEILIYYGQEKIIKKLGKHYDNPSEFFAESFGLFYSSGSTRKYLRKHFARAHEFIKQAEERFADYFDQNIEQALACSFYTDV